MSKDNNKQISKAKKIYNVISTALVALLFVFLVVVVCIMLVQRNNGSETEIFGYYFYDVLTDSMSGTIEPGEVIISKKVEDVNTLKVGDIITFKAPDGDYNETHRIIEIVYNDDGSIDYFRTQGDNAQSADNWKLRPENIKAIYVRKSAFIGGLRSFLSNWYGYVVLIVLPMCIVIALVIASFVKEKIALDREENKQTGISLDNISEEDKRRLLEIALSQNADLSSENKTDINVDLPQCEDKTQSSEESSENRDKSADSID